MRKLGIVLAVLVLAVAVSSCANRKVSRVDAGEVIDLSGNWNDTDSQMVSEEMINDLLHARWLPVYEAAHGDKRPVIVVGTVTNKSHEHINSETFIKDIEKAIINDGSARLVQAGEKRQELRDERYEQNQGYTLPEKWVRKATLSKCRIYLTAENPFVFTNYEGVDPEGATAYAYPSVSSWIVGVNLSF